MKGQLEFIVVRDIQDLKLYKNKWNAILLQNNNNNPFIEYEWIKRWWKYLGKYHELFVIVIRKNSEIIGFCPLMLTKKLMYEEINFIGHPNTPYMDLVILNSFRKDVIGELMNYLISINKSYIFNIHGLSENSDDFSNIESYFKKNRHSLLICKLRSRYIDTSSGDFESFYRQRCTHNSVKNIAKCEKKLRKIGNLTYKKLDVKNIDSIYAIHNKRWHKKNDGSSFSKGEVKELFRQLALDSNMPFDAIIDGLYLDDRLIAFRYGFLFNKRYICFRVAHDDLFAAYGPGKIIYKEKIKECFDGDIDICEFGPGRFDQHKAYWTDCIEYINRVIFPGKNIISRLVYRKYVFSELLKEVLRKHINISYFKIYVLGAVKYTLSKNAFNNFKKAVIESFNLSYVKKLKAEFLRYYHYRKKEIKFDVYKKELSDSLPDNGKQLYNIEYATINELEDIMEIMKLKSIEILRRFEKGSKCIKLMKGTEIIAWSWVDEMKLNTRISQGIKNLDNGSICIYDLWMISSLKDFQIYKDALKAYCYLLKNMGKKCIYIAVERHENLLMKSLNELGFKKI